MYLYTVADDSIRRVLPDRFLSNRLAILIGAAFIFLYLLQGITADEVKMKNGSVIEGTVLERTEAELVLRRTTGEEQTIPRSDVETFTIHRTKITLKGGDTLTGRIVDEQEGKRTLEVERGAQVVLQEESIEKTEEVTKKFAGSPPGKEIPPEGPAYWSGEFSLGYTVRRGNTTEDDFYTRGRLTYDRKPVNNVTTAQYNYATSEDETTADEGELENQLNYSITDYIFLYHDVTGGYDNIRDIDYFIDTSAGVGVELLVDSPSVLKFRAGPSYRFEKRDGAEDREEASALFGESFQTKLNDRVTLFQEYKFLPSITNSGEYRQEASVELKIALSDSWTLNLYGEQVYDSNPVPGTEKEDLKFVSTLGYSF